MSTQPERKSTKSPITHTPGPWEITSDGNGCHEIRMATALNESWGSETHHIIEYNHSLYHDDGDQFKEAEANARLIAAAPDSHQANQDAIALLRFIRDHEPQSWDRVIANTGSHALQTWDALKAAISKAEGR